MPEGSFWSKQEEYTLLQGVSIYGLAWFSRKTGRSLAAVNAKARRLYEGGGLTRGAYTLRSACRNTGYHSNQLKRAMRALRQKWKRTSPRGSFLIHEEQLDELVAWLITDYWVGYHRLYGCVWCGTADRPHCGRGLCLKCYHRYTQRIRRGGFPRSSSGLLEVARRVLTSGQVTLLAEIEKALGRGRVPSEWALAQLIQCKAAV